jgi:hexosaminidase
VLCPHSFKISSNIDDNEVVDKAVIRYHDLIFGDALKSESLLQCNSDATQELYIDIHDATALDLQLGVDESYTLSINKEGMVLSAETVWGALRGLETFSQLVLTAPSRGTFYTIENTPIEIQDSPRFPWRGILIDTSRHYLSVKKILQIIDALSYNKMNTLHWHMVDAQSFPVEIKSFPLLSQKGAYDRRAIYTQNDMKKIVKHAYLRGVRVVPEFDMPGHAAAWGAGYPITTICPSFSDNVNNVPLNPSNNLTFTIIDAVFTEMAGIFFDKYLHLGGDEMCVACWNEDKTVLDFMNTMGFGTDYNKLWAYFEKTVEPLYLKQNKTLACWAELALNNPEFTPMKGAVAFAWVNRDDLLKVVTSGYVGVLSAGFYLDQQIPAGGTHYLWGDTWQNFYLNEPFGGDVASSWTDDLKAKVLGGEASMWGEQVDDTDFDVRVWPRASAVGERLWSLQEYNDVNEAAQRLQQFRCHLVGRGVMAGPISPDFCESVYDFSGGDGGDTSEL